MRRIDRYLLSEMILPALIGGLLVVMLLVGNQLYGLLRFLYSGVPLRDVLMTLLYFTPGVLMLAIPASMLLGTALGLNRLERDREILSLRMAGVRLKRIVLPVIIIGMLASAGMFYLQERIIPYTTHQAIKLSQKLAYGSATALIQRDKVFKVENAGTTYFIYVREVDPNPDKQLLYGIVVMRINRVGPPTLMTIPRAENRNGEWLMLPHQTTAEKPHVYLPVGEGTMNEIEFADGSWVLPKETFNVAYDQRVSPDEFTFHELLATARSGVRGASAFSLKNGVVLDRKNLSFYLHRKLAAPLAALVAILIAIPLSVHFGRSGGYVGLLLSVVVAFCFVITQQWTQVLAETGRMHPIFAAWAPNAFYGILGIVLLFREE